MVEIFDIGNTCTRIAEWDGERFVSVRRVATAEFCGTPGDVPKVAACVCPPVRERLGGSGIKFITAAEQSSAVDFSLVDTSTLGADRVANAVAAAALYELPAVVIDCGTAITMEVVDRDRKFRGGAIAPGRRLMRQALHCGTAQLPEIPLDGMMPDKPGCNTRDAIRFGVDRGSVGMIKEFLTQVQLYFPVATVILTGGDAGYYAAEFPEAVIAGDDFTLTGIRIAGGY